MKQANTLSWLMQAPAKPDTHAGEIAAQRQASLTKPPGALGRLEEVAIRLATLQGKSHPAVDRVQITVFAGDHGVATDGISAFPQEVTAQMVRNFGNNGAAICVAARALKADLDVVNLGTVVDVDEIPGVSQKHLGFGTANMTQEAAMSEEQLAGALEVGRQMVDKACDKQMQLFIGGEMGIGNTTTAAALACALLDASPQKLAGPGTGIDAAGIAHKVDVITRALALHIPASHSHREVLRRLGGFEIAALTGSYISAAQRGLPVLIDGFISSVAALAAARLCPKADEWFFYAHESSEPGHRPVLQTLAAEPLLDLGLRLGEGSGAAVAVPLLRMACALHNEMMTFEQAGVAGKID